MSRAALILVVIAVLCAPAPAETYWWGEIGQGGIVWIDGWGDWGEVGFWYEDYYVDVFGVGQDMLYIEENGDIWAEDWLWGYMNPYGDVYSDARGYQFTIEYDPEYDDFHHDGVYAFDPQTVFFVLAFEEKFYGTEAGLHDVFTFNQPPDALILWDKAGAWDEVRFVADALDLDGEIVDVEWEFGDGTWSNDFSPVHIYGKKGRYEVALTVWDDRGASDWTSTTVKIESRPPRAGFKRKLVYSTPGKVQFFDKSRDPNGIVTDWYWDFGDGSTSTEREPAHVYAGPGTYWVSLTVTDDDGQVGVRGVRIKVDFMP
jgi:chitodextrinase